MAEAHLIPEPTTAVVLAGGRGSRMGGVDKGEIVVDGNRLIDIVVASAIESGCDRVFVVGETESPGAVSLVEQPRFGGPVAGLAAAVPHVRTDWIMLLACDLPHAAPLCDLISRSAEALDAPGDGIVISADGQKQWLTGWYRTETLRSALANLGDPSGAAVRRLLGGLDLHEIADTGGWSRDIDTPEDLDNVTREEHR